MRLSTSLAAAIMACHLLTFACAALLATALVRWVGETTGSLAAGLATAVVVLTTPLVAVQIDMLGMDLPMTTACVLAAGHLTAGRYGRAWCWSALAFAAKQTGGLLAIASIVFLLLRWCVLDRPQRRILGPRLLGAATWHFFLLQFEVFLVEWVARLPQSRFDHLNRDLRFGLANLAQAVRWCPETALAVALLLAALGGSLLRAWRAAPTASASARDGRAWPAAWCGAHQTPLLAGIVLLGMLGMLSFLYTIPRYLVLPCTMAWAALACFPGTKRTRQGAGLAAALVLAWNLLNACGRWLPVADTSHRTGAVLERSREYLRDHRTNRELVRFLVDHVGSRALVVGNPLVYFLAQPRLGYVTQPLSGYALHAFTSPTFPRVERMLTDRPAQVWWVEVPNSFRGTGPAAEPRLLPGDEIVWRDRGPGNLVVFRRPALETSDAAARELVLRQALFPDTLGAEDPFRLASQGRLLDAARILRERLGREPANLDLRYNLGVVLAKSGELAEARRELRQVVEADRARDAAWDQLGTVLADQGQLPEAAEALRQAARLAPRQGSYQLHLGLVLSRQADWPAAAQAFAAAAKLDVLEPTAPYLLGLALRMQGGGRETIEHFREALRREARQPDAAYQLALVYDELGDAPQAVDYYRQALAHRPGWIEPANNLAWLLATDARPEVRNGTEAVRWAELVRQTAGDQSPALLDTLAAAYAEAGRFDEAVAVLDRALALAEKAQLPLADLQARRALYQARQPYRHAPAAAP